MSLSLRRLTRDYLDLLDRLNSDPQVMRYLGGPKDRAKSEAMLNERILVLFPQHWGRGYATEMAIALLRYGYTVLGLPLIVAIADLPNAESQGVLLKAGLQRKGERTFPDLTCGSLVD